MKILSWNGGMLKPHPARVLQKHVLQSEGPVMFPITVREYESARRNAFNSKFMQALNRPLKGKQWNMQDLASWAISNGKQVEPLHSEKLEEISMRHSKNFSGLDLLPEHISAQDYMQQAAINLDAERMSSMIDEVLRKKPGLVIALDYNAVLIHRGLGDNSGNKLVRLTMHTPGTRSYAARVWESLLDRWKKESGGKVQ
jgi:hypothetical protein